MSHSPARINPDSRAVLTVAVVVTGALALVSFLLSYAGLVAVASWAAVPSWLAWAVPVTIDGAILVYTLAALVFRARAESARVAWLSLSLFTSLSVLANGAHAWDAGDGDLRAMLGAVIAGLAPVAVLLTTHTIARLIIAPAVPLDVPPVPAAVPPVSRPAEVTEPLDEALTPPLPEPDAVPLVVSDVDRAGRDERIRSLATGDLSLREIATQVGVSKSTVSRVLNRHPDDDLVESVAAPA